VLSGDAASAGLLSFLSGLTKDRRDVRISAIAVDPGLAGFPVTERVRAIAGSLGVEWYAGSLGERYGITLSGLVQEEGPEMADRACRVLAEDLLGEIAAAQGVTRCAIDTSVDETAGVFFADLLAGTPEHTLFSRNTLGRSGIPVIRPFMDIPAAETARYAELNVPPGPEGFFQPCPSTGNSSPGRDADGALEIYTRRHPAAKFALANLAGALAESAAAHPPVLLCPVCGEPLETGACPICAIREKYGKGTA
jgi:tRNA(Ile)-lysidine synthase TilS/MesJ